MYVTLSPTELQRWKVTNILPNTKSSSFTAGVELLQAIGNKIKDTQQKYLPYSPVDIVIAGGSVRDLLFDFEPKDIDIFISSSPPYDAEELEDICDLLMNELSNETPWEGSSKQYPNNEQGDGFKLLEGVFDIPDSAGSAMLQLISRPFTTFEELVNDFDYDLVRGYYDITRDVFVLHENMLHQAKTRSITISSDKTKKRVVRWLDRNNLLKDFTTEYTPEYQQHLDDLKEEMKKRSRTYYNTDFFTTTTVTPITAANNYWIRM